MICMRIYWKHIIKRQDSAHYIMMLRDKEYRKLTDYSEVIFTGIDITDIPAYGDHHDIDEHLFNVKMFSICNYQAIGNSRMANVEQ